MAIHNSVQLQYLTALTNAIFGCNELLVRRPEIVDVKFNPPATIVFWSDRTKTVVKCRAGEAFDPEKGLAMAICKRMLGTNKSYGNYYNVFKRWSNAESVNKEPSEDIVNCNGKMPRHSGRYPWDKGDEGAFLDKLKELHGTGLTEYEIAEKLEIPTVDELRMYYRIAQHEQRMSTIASIKSMKDDGFSVAEIAEKLGLKSESAVRSLIGEDSE